MGGVEQAPDAAGELAFEAANRFALGFAFGVFACEVGAGCGGSVLARESAMMWIARLSCRLPPRCRRWRWVLPDEAGIGAVPACRAKCPSLGKRCAPAVWPMMIAAVMVPQPGWASSWGACASIRLPSSANSSRCARPISAIRLSSRRVTRSRGDWGSRASWRVSRAQIRGPFQRCRA